MHEILAILSEELFKASQKRLKAAEKPDQFSASYFVAGIVLTDISHALQKASFQEPRP